MPRAFLISLVLLSTIWANDINQSIRESLNTLNNLHSADTLNRNFGRPLTGAGDFHTLDNSQTFHAGIECPSKEKAVVITFLPLSNGEWRIVIAGDLNLDGQYEYHFDTDWLGIRVSGVCSNGIVYCEPYNRWDLNHCRYYKWTQNGNWITLRETQNRDEVGACICTNYSCNGGNIPPYRWIAGAVSNQLMQIHPELLISKGEWDLSNFSYYLYGQDTRSCRGIEGEVTDLGGVPLTNYASAHTYPSVDLSDIAAHQESDPNSPYNTLMSASQVEYNGYSVGVPNIYSCWIKKDIQINTIQRAYSCSNLKSLNGQTYCVITSDFHSCGCHVCARINSSVTIRKNQSLILLVPGHKDNCDDDGNTLKFTVSGDINFSGSYSCSSWNFKATRIINIVSNADREYKVTIKASRCHEGHCGCSTEDLYLLLSQNYLEDTYSFITNNGCNPDDRCRLRNEWICPPNVNLPSNPSLAQLRQYCIQTINEGIRLHPRFQPMCKTVSTEVDTYQICMDGERVTVTNSRGETVYTTTGDYMWFKVYREYNCGIREFNIDLTKINRTRDSASSQGQNISYTDYVGETGHQTIYVNLGNLNSCPVPSCVVRYPEREADVFSDSSNREQVNTSVRNEYAVVECRQNSAGVWYCPVPTGGVILQPCSCTQGYTGFNLALSVLQAVNEASHDIICSSQ